VQNTHIEGLEATMCRFGDIVEEIRRKPYDLLDASKNIFDRDFLEFNVHINDLELAVQVRLLHASRLGSLDQLLPRRSGYKSPLHLR
jgi:hypothetical protein